MAFCTSQHTYLKVCLGSLVLSLLITLQSCVLSKSPASNYAFHRLNTGLLLSAKLVFVQVYIVCVFLELCAMLAEFFHCFFVLLPSTCACTVLL